MKMNEIEVYVDADGEIGLTQDSGESAIYVTPEQVPLLCSFLQKCANHIEKVKKEAEQNA